MLTLTTDFGDSEYVAQMKGVIYGLRPEARIVDVSHSVRAQNVLQGAYVLAASVPFFPDGSVHVAVVDPGVGGDRRALAIRCRRGYLVGPDNGLLWPAAVKLGLVEARAISNPDVRRNPVSATFHGRDVFAPAAAHILANGRPGFHDVGQVVTDAVALDLSEGARADAKGLRGVVLHVDRFGNIITNIAEGALAPWADATHLAIVRGKLRHPARRVRTYSQAGPDEFEVLASSSGFVEIALNEANAAQRLNTVPGDPVRIETRE